MARRRDGGGSPETEPRSTGWRRTLGLGALLAGLTGAAVVVMSRRRDGSGDETATAGPDAGSLAAGYETHDMDAAGLARIIAGFAVTVAAAIGLMFWMIGFFVDRDLASRPPLTAQEQARIEPPGPQLQVHPFKDIATLRVREDRLLGSYAWLAPDHKQARIPIDRAMALVIGRPLDPDPRGGDASSPAPPR